MTTIPVDVLILGGGAAGLWTLDELVRHGYSTLLIESYALGSGQTVASQGIIHGGLKYTLTGTLTSSAQMIRQMPLIWRDCFAGQRQPDLSSVAMRSPSCHLWRTQSLRSQFGMVGARVGLNVKPQKLDHADWPAVLSQCPGHVYKLDEQVMKPASFIEALARPHADKLIQASPERIRFETAAPGQVSLVHIGLEESGETLVIQPAQVVLTAGAGNASLREKAGLAASAMQRRPLHMVLARGQHLPVLNGHCVDGAKTRVTITTDQDSQGWHVWQVGGQISEEGVAMEPLALIRHAIKEVRASIPGVDLSGVSWATYRVDRAEAAHEQGLRPDDVHLALEGNTFTAWPTKLALAPRLAEQLLARLAPPAVAQPARGGNWPRPGVAKTPWEQASHWLTTEQAMAMSS